ncbi:Dyp-type peroxidase [Lolliginicoccus suaedae]|uniref:Dyp-type peroxidase n=1 Tax=Lolliginicoccus suaedae TaxID=2605429 RepID=UPI0011EC8BB8|nr:Dyp-type peroxidase [Lolliginicoccus suaedae]
MSTEARAPGISRRHLLGSGAVAAGAAGLGWGGRSLADQSAASTIPAGQQIVPFHGPHQAGITTPPPAHATFVALDLQPGLDRSAIIGLLKAWTQDAARLAEGRPALADSEPELAAAPSRLTTTIGLGPAVFDVAGIADRRPSWIAPLPPLPIDELDPRYNDGDLLLQVCSDDPVVVAHAVRILTRSVRSLATVRWTQRGFREARGSHPEGHTMRNLMGQVDGTNNPKPREPGFEQVLWHDDPAYPWLRGGTSMVVRRIAMDLDTWDELGRRDRELSIGRTLGNGAPLTGTKEHDPPDFGATDQFGIPIIPPSSHIARARAQAPEEVFLRRGYNYDDPPEPGRTSNSGLIFATFQADIAKQFLPVQRRIAEFDVLNEWTTPIGSAVFAIPPGCEPGDYIGRPLLEGPG